MPADSLALPSVTPTPAAPPVAPARPAAPASSDGRPAGFGQALERARLERASTERQAAQHQATERQAEGRRAEGRRADNGDGNRPAPADGEAATAADPVTDPDRGDGQVAEAADEERPGSRARPRRLAAAAADDAGNGLALALPNPAGMPADNPARTAAGPSRDAQDPAGPADALAGLAVGDRARPSDRAAEPSDARVPATATATAAAAANANANATANATAGAAATATDRAVTESGRPDALVALSTAGTDSRPAAADGPASGLGLPGLEAASGLARSAAAGGAQTSAAGEAAGTAQAPIDTPVDSPQFGAALGHRLSLMVKDGLSEARLQLHPAEMGPLQVRIALEGQMARVDLVAEQAATRQILEQSMPGLASALRDSGLTLAGGGVFDSPRDPRQDAAAGQAGGRSDRPGAADGDDDDGPALRTAAGGHGRARGVVDLYA